jgi:cytochrome c556
MTMDDQFLHRLRREPPAKFAIRLKGQLDRPIPTRRSPTRLILLLAICGTAFALVSPPGRRALGDWFTTAPGPPQPARPEIASAPPPAAGATSRGPSAPSGDRPRQVATLPASPAPLSATVPAADAPQTATLDPQATPRSTFAPVPVVAGSLLQPPEVQAVAAALTRQGLFRTLSFVWGPLTSMQRNIPLDMGVVRTSAIRLATLSALIPEVFSKDTRPFAVDTRAADSIWSEPQDFAAKADALTLAADALATAAATDDDVDALRAIARIQAACNACHAVYLRR